MCGSIALPDVGGNLAGQVRVAALAGALVTRAAKKRFERGSRRHIDAVAGLQTSLGNGAVGSTATAGWFTRAIHKS